MVAVTNTRVIFKEIPSGYPEPGKTTVVDTTDKIDLDTVGVKGGILVKTIALSIDPYQRGRMRDEKIKSYVPAFKLGQPIDNHGVAVVLRSEHDKFKSGDYVFGMLPFAEYSVISDPSSFRVLPADSRLPWTAFIGVAGMPGQTAYFGWKQHSEAKKGQVAFVSGGAGPVGSFVIQLAKRDGMKVIASAGSEKKVEFMKSVGADVAFNYKTTSTEEILAKEGPIDVYWDNVGGDTLDAALANAAVHSRFIECGMISGYNEKSSGLKNVMNILTRRVHVHGIMWADMLPKYGDEFYQTVPKAVANGEFKHAEHVYHGLEQAGQAILDVQTGKNDAKAVILVAEA